MKNLLMRCPHCGIYTMKEVCANCGLATVIAHPARFSPDDKYARYRSPLAYQEESEAEQRRRLSSAEKIDGVRPFQVSDVR